MIKISDIPEAIFPIIQSFLIAEDYHYFIHADKRFFGGIKQKTIYYSFNYFYSIKYVMDKAFQSMIQGKVNDTSKQVCLVLDRRSMSSQVLLLSVHELIIEDIRWGEYLPKPSMNQELPPLFLNLSSIITKGCDDLPLPFLPSLKELSFTINFSLKRITTTQNLQKLTLRICTDLVEVTIDHPLLELDLQGCGRLTSVNPSGNNLILAKKVMIHDCAKLNLNNFQQYSQVHDLTISEYLQDFPVSLKHLKGIHSLSLINCTKLSNISDLGNHYKLEISFTKNYSVDQVTYPLVGYEILQGISHVILKRVNIVDVHVLREAKSLYLEYCEGITDVSPLMNIMDLTVDKCWNISNLHLLTKIPRLFLTNIKDAIIEYQERDSSDYKHQILSIQSCSLPQSFFKPMLCLYKLFLGFIKTPLQFNDDILSSFPILQYICIRDCQVQSMKGLGRIHTVEIRYCSELKDINGLGENHTVILAHCSSVDVDCLVNVPVVSIKWCGFISERSILLLQDKVPRFTFLEEGSNFSDSF